MVGISPAISRLASFNNEAKPLLPKVIKQRYIVFTYQFKEIKQKYRFFNLTDDDLRFRITSI